MAKKTCEQRTGTAKEQYTDVTCVRCGFVDEIPDNVFSDGKFEYKGYVCDYCDEEERQKEEDFRMNELARIEMEGVTPQPKVQK